MTARTTTDVYQELAGFQESRYDFGSVTSKLDVTISETLIDSGDPIQCIQKGGEAEFTNDDAAETVTIRMYVSKSHDDDWSVNPERFAQLGKELVLGPDSSGSLNWDKRYEAIVFTKQATGAVTGGLYGQARNPGSQ